MNSRTFLDNFAHLADAPNGIQKLRQLILQLAVQGKLVHHDPIDEPAEMLLERITGNRQILEDRGEIRNSRPVPDVGSAEIPFVVPTGWIWSRVGRYAYIEMGQSPESRYYNDTGDGLPFYQGKSEFGSLYPEPRKWCTRPSKLAEKHDILISVRAPVGPTNMCRVRSCIGRGLAAIRCLSNACPSYLMLALRAFEKQIANMGVGSTFTAISRKDIEQFKVPIPPLAEQKRIVAKVDELMALCDELEARQAERNAVRTRLHKASLDALLHAEEPREFHRHWTRIHNHFDLLHLTPESIPALRQAILHLAVQGKLVPQDPKDEPAALLLGRVHTRREESTKLNGSSRTKPIDTLELDDIPFPLPSGWVCERFGLLSDIIGGVTKGRNLAGRETVALPYLRVANVQRGFLDLEVMKSILLPVNEVGKYALMKDDLLITEGGDWDKVGRTAIWRDEIPGCIHQNHVFRARLFEKTLSPKWVETYVNSEVGRTYFEGASKQTTNLASINMTQLRHFPLPIPPAVEQKRIVAKVDELLALCDALEGKLTSAEASREQLTEAVVRKLSAA